MPAKYSHTKKRPPGHSKKSNSSIKGASSKGHRTPNPQVDRSISQAMSAVSQMERAIARILLIRFEQDIARLFSTHLYCVALLQLPTLVMRCTNVSGPGWVAANADCDEIKDFFRSVIGMDLRQAGERVATKSVLWSYTALRHFAISNNVPICQKRGLHSLRLLPHFPALQAHLDTLQAMPAAAFAKPPHLGPLKEGIRTLEDYYEHRYSKTSVHGDWDPEWRQKVRVGYERISETLWRVAREFNVQGYGLVLRKKLMGNWCDCGCSTDHLSEVCEKTVREDEEESGVRPGKQREWDGRGSGVFGWETEDEEDIWDVDLDFVSLDPEEGSNESRHLGTDMTIGEIMEWRYFRAEHEKEQGNASFKIGDYETAVEQYKSAHQIESEMPHYQLNLAAAYLKLQRWMDAENACDAALSQHRSVKGHWRRAQARKFQDKRADAIKDLRAILRLQPSNTEAQAELDVLLPRDFVPPDRTPTKLPPTSSAEPSSSRTSYPSYATSASSSSLLASASSSGPFSRASVPPPDSASTSRSTTPTNNKPHRVKQRSSGFTRTPSDNFKLKITLLPMTIDIPSTSSIHCHPKAKDHSHSTRGKSMPLKDVKKKHTGGGNRKDKNGVGIAIDDTGDTKYQQQTFSYPSWDRYTVQKVSR